MPTDFLEEILAYKRELLERKNPFYASLKKKAKNSKVSRYSLFKKAISRPGAINLIAEIKKASPSRGLICKNFNVLQIAEAYVTNGAAALSILTEDKFFLGKPSYLKQVGDNFNVPLLTKDFIIDEAQIFEAFYLGTSAILLIAAILEDSQLEDFLGVASNLDLDCLVEIHDEQELERALRAGAEIIGVNNRDLRSFKVDLKTSGRIIPKIPKGKVIVAESGIKTYQDVKELEALGAHAVLIGETFLQADNVGEKVKEVMYGS